MPVPPFPARDAAVGSGFLTARWLTWLSRLLAAVNRVDGYFLQDGSWVPPEIADADAANSTVYYSTTASKLVFKDSGGIVRNLW